MIGEFTVYQASVCICLTSLFLLCVSSERILRQLVRKLRVGFCFNIDFPIPEEIETLFLKYGTEMDLISKRNPV